MKYRTQSANVLNEADRFQAILDWQLFCMEQETVLYGYSEDTSWTPGDPINTNPKQRERDLENRLFMGRATEEDLWDGPWGNHLRPMFQVYDFINRSGDDEGLATRTERTAFYPWVRCEPCGVSWNDSDECWVCGKFYPRLDTKPKGIFGSARQAMIYASAMSRHSVHEPMFDVVDVEVSDRGMYATMRLRDQITDGLTRELGENWRRLMQEYMDQMSVSFRRAAESLRGARADYVVFDEARLVPYAMADVEWSRRAWLNANPPVRYHPPAPARSMFERNEPREVVLVENPWAGFGEYVPTPATGRTRFGRLIQDAWSQWLAYTPTHPPVRQRAPIILEMYNSRRYPQVTINQQVTEQRRRRNL